jgi:hypothetical protein
MLAVLLLQATFGLPATVLTGQAVEVRAQPPAGALETGMSGDILRLYGGAMAAAQAGSLREALPLLREARALCHRQLLHGPTPRVLAYRHLQRALYAEEEITELLEVDRRLQRLRDVPAAEERTGLQQERALVLHNLFLLVRGFSGLSDERLLSQALSAYELIQNRPGPLRTLAQLGHAALLAERGDLAAAQRLFQRISADEREAERYDLPVAYYHLATADRQRALLRLLRASRRDTWERGSGLEYGRSLRSMVYRMSDFDRLRDHPLFIELVTDPEERGR